METTENKIQLKPNYSYEYNKILNEQYTNENDQIKNFASLISDKDRFLTLLPLIQKNQNLIEKTLDYKFPEKIKFYIVRAEKFKSFSLPITIEYSICPEEMLLFLLKEIFKQTITDRFTDEQTREHYINANIDYLIINGNWNNLDLVKFTKNLHEESKKIYPNYKYEDLDFQNNTMKQLIEKSYENL